MREKKRKKMTKHHMFGAPNLRQAKKKFTQLQGVMVETFRMPEYKSVISYIINYQSEAKL